MATFGLVHGAWHGAWCWQYLTPRLAALGHRALAVDLPIEDAAATTVEYAEVAANALRGASDLIVVAHSMAGIVAPLIADRIPLSGIAYLCAVLRRPGKSLADDREAGVNSDIGTPGFGFTVKSLGDGFSVVETLAGAGSAFYHDCSPADAAWAFARFRKQRGYWADRSPQAAWPAVPAASIVCSADHAVNPVWSRRVARDWLKVEPIEFASGHSPFMARPRELALLLDRLARTTFVA